MLRIIVSGMVLMLLLTGMLMWADHVQLVRTDSVAPGQIRFEVLGDAQIEWTNETVHSGNYSAKLVIPKEGSTGSWAFVKVSYGNSLETLGGFSFYVKYVNACASFAVYLDKDKDGATDGLLYSDPLGTGNNTWTLGTGGLSYGWTEATYPITQYGAVWESLSYWKQMYPEATVLHVAAVLQYHRVEPAGLGEPLFVDEAVVNGISYDLEPSGQVEDDQAGDWLSIEDEHFVVKYKEGFISDAELMLENCRFARNVTMEVYPHELHSKVKVYLYDAGNWTRGPYTCWADPTNAEMHFLSPSDVPEDAKSWVDNVWYQKNVVHEYVHIPTWKDMGGHGSAKNPPTWLMEGIAEYVAVFCTSEEIMQKYKGNLDEIENCVKRGDGYILIVSGNTYYGGACILKYMCETYGQDRVLAVFKNEANSFMEALENALEVTYWEFENEWVKWAVNEFGADPDTYVQLESYEGEQQYLELLEDYQGLNATYNELKAKNDRLLAFPDINGDGRIDMVDIGTVARHFQEHYP